MLFRAENLGPVREAELDLSKSLIILAGPNNSGKTYLGWALYGLSQFNKALPCVRELLDALIASPGGTYVTETAQTFIARFAGEFCELYAKHIHRDFSASATTFVSTHLALAPTPGRRVHQSGSFITEDHVFDVSFSVDDSIQLVLEVTRQERDRNHTSDANGPGIDAVMETVPLSSISPEIFDRFVGWATRLLTVTFKRALFPSRFTIFPVERIATTIFARELMLRRMEAVEEDDADEAGRLASVAPVAGRYPLPIRHSLLNAADLSESSRHSSEFEDLARELESSVLQGRFSVAEHGDMLFFPHAKPQQPLGLHQSASVVKSLSAIVFYFRHIARIRDHIIIDEPELNLHPDNQRRVARVLAKAVNRGIKIMMSTHSDYLIGEFNNLLMLGRDTPQATAVREELGYDAASTLKPEQVGVYLVSDGLCKPIEVKPTGFEIKTFEDAFHSMNRDAQTIYSRVFAESE